MDNDNMPEVIDDRSHGNPEPARKERYNTEYLVGDFTKRERRTRMIIAAIAISTTLAVLAGFFLSGKKEMPKVAGDDAPAPASAPAAPAPAK